MVQNSCDDNDLARILSSIKNDNTILKTYVRNYLCLDIDSSYCGYQDLVTPNRIVRCQTMYNSLLKCNDLNTSLSH